MANSFPRLALAGALLLAAVPAAAQPGTAVRAGQTVSGTLGGSDPKLDDGSFYDQYVYRGRPGEQVVITMRSGAFDTYLSAGTLNGTAFSSSATDDDGAGGTDSRLSTTVGASGVLVIRANSLSGGATGAYTLEIGGSAGSGAQAGGQTGAQPGTISAGQTVNGRLDSSDMKLGDNSYADEYRYAGRPGEQVVITLRSSDFDTYLVWGTGRGTGFVSKQTDDDGAGGTDSRLSVTVGDDGSYTIRANSLAANSTGAYTLSVERAGGGATPINNQTRPQPSGGGATISAGQTVSGELQASDMKLADNSFADEYRYTGRPGEEIVITLRSPSFDTYLVWGQGQGSAFRSEKTDDDGAGGTDSQLRVTVGSGGTYTIRANSLAANTTGPYTLSVQASGGGQAVAAGGVIRAGQNVTGRLERSDPRLPDNSHYDSYVYQGTPGEQILITMTSTEFDTYLRWGRGQGSQFQLLGTDDDAGGGTNSRMQVTVDASSTYTIQANSLAANTTGAYTLAVERASGAAPAGAQTLSMGQTVSGRLDASDPKLSDNSHYDLYVYRGRPGERVLVTMRSGDFDTYMAWGRLVGSRFEAETRDDDGGGGTNSQLIGTVGASGTYAVQANSLGAGATGAYTLSVQPVGAAAQQTSSAPAVPAGAVTVTAGQTINGELTASDPMLSDSSFYDQYVYQGRAGDRLQITMRSSDFDTYLRWGRLEGGRFQSVVNDDDGAGGTNAQATVTVGGTGVYVIQANAYAAGKTGRYTLTVQPLSAAPAPTAAEARTAGQNKWLFGSTEATTPALRTLGQRIKQAGMMERFTESLNSNTNLPPLPRSVGVRLAQCGNVNAFYSPRQGAVTMCYELLNHLANIFVPDGRWTQAQSEAVDGAVNFIMYHEVGHALVDVMDLPVTGREEDAVDQLATYILVGSGEKGAQAAFNGVLAVQPGRNAVYDNSDFADEHSLGPVRLFNIACWVYGSDPQKYSRIVSEGMLPRERAVRCPGEYQRMSKAWERLLSANRNAR
jgi:3'-phosphoadenosine 5'-phosphosulfate sulfotransferase